MFKLLADILVSIYHNIIMYRPCHREPNEKLDAMYKKIEAKNPSFDMGYDVGVFRMFAHLSQDMCETYGKSQVNSLLGLFQSTGVLPRGIKEAFNNVK